MKIQGLAKGYWNKQVANTREFGTDKRYGLLFFQFIEISSSTPFQVGCFAKDPFAEGPEGVRIEQGNSSTRDG